ncbi:hypothetical protein [Mesorhizobium sp. M0244]|uniref:hypothetical protein n=1 Tax=Mesorhizobium sp. M0244 TaxID=2956926 RepID=UPI00333CBCDC
MRIEGSYERRLLRDRFFQQPDVDNVLLVPVTPVLTQDVPSVPTVGTVTLGLVTGSDILGVGMPVIELTPKLPSSEDPSGIPTGVPTLVDDVPDDVPVVVDSVAVVLEADVLELVELQVPDAVEPVKLADDIPLVDVVPLMPPPSKVEGVEVLPATPELDARTPGATTLVHPESLMELFAIPMELPALPMEPDVVAELNVVKPPGSSSTAPKGIPTGLVPTGLRGEPTAERGEVIPIAGVVVLTCAKLGPLDNSAIATVISKLGIATLCSFRIGTTVVSCV